MKLTSCLNIVLLVEYVISRCPPSDYYPIPSFGENCRYRCHCAADVQCHNITGDCPGPCAHGWMGPACQYSNVALNATNVIQNGVNVNPEAVNDGNLTTCSDVRPFDNGSEYFWRIELSRPFYIVGIIVHTLSGAQSTSVRIETADVMNFSIGNQTCVKSFTIVENGTTEVICRQPVVARALQFVNQGNRSTISLCELEIYGGQTNGFTLTIGNNIYQDSPTNSPSDYLPWTLDLEQPVTGNTVKLNRSGILTLCEVIVYAECLPGWCGWDCSDVCMCNTPHTGSPRLKAVCSFGCQDGWSGTYGKCDKACNEGWFGHNCSATCENCQGGRVNCNHVTGVCSKGCLPGYNNSDVTCVQACKSGWFGQNCSAKCGNCQGGGVNCHFVTGVCSEGCLPGYNNSDVKCMQACSPGWFGQNCPTECGSCQGGGANCHHMSGVCTEGCKPGYNHSDLTCMQSCSHGWFGQNCSAECGNCHGGGVNCDHVSGVCTEGCLPGYNDSDVTCMEAVQCPFHTYGRDCTPCGPCKNELCDPVSGECPFGCYDGYVGKKCETIITNTEVSVGGLTGTGIGVGVGVGVASTLLVVGMIVAVFWAKKRRNNIYEEPIVRLTREQAGESAYASLQGQRNQSVDISGKIQEYENTMDM